MYWLFMAGVTPAIQTLMVRVTDVSFGADRLGSRRAPTVRGDVWTAHCAEVSVLFLSIHWIFVTAGLILIVAAIAVWFNKGIADEAQHEETKMRGKSSAG